MIIKDSSHLGDDPRFTDKAHFTEEDPTINDDYLFAASYNDCTGLIPSLPQNEEEVKNYEEISHYLPPIPPAK